MTGDKCSSDILLKFSLAATFLWSLSGVEVKFKAFLSLEMAVNKWSASVEIELMGRNKIKQRKQQRKTERKILQCYWLLTNMPYSNPSLPDGAVFLACTVNVLDHGYGRLKHREGRKRGASAQIRRQLIVHNATSRKVITLDIKIEESLLPKGAPKQ
jgi:hypothetical protein